MLLKTLGVISTLVILLLAVASFQKTDFTISRSLVINAPTTAIHAQINDFHAWQAWSPWAQMDTKMLTRFDGPPSGQGASYYWKGNSKVGEGTMTIVSSAPELIVMNLDFKKPMKATNIAEFRLSSEGQGTLVTWTMTGKNGLLSKTIGLFLNMDKLVGSDFEKGLAQLKLISEVPAKSSGN
ncbi:MAG: SRPBCC family protein [Bdellovibrionota bacterium]